MSLLDPSMDDLPVEFIVDILSRLPVKKNIHCKCVCKKWRNIVLDSYFINLQLSRSPAGLMICHDSKLDYHNYEEDEAGDPHLHLDPVRSFDLNLAPNLQNPYIFPLGSVNGLLYLSQELDNNEKDTLICNPITREYIILPRQQYYSGGPGGIASSVCCFGFGSVTREYKVIWIFQRFNIRRPPNYMSKETKIYTLGTGKWRSLDDVPYLLKGSGGSFVNGHAHWTVVDKDSPLSICAFDFDKETFELFPSPPSEAINGRLGVLKGCLCLCESHDDKVTVWVMKEYGIKKSWYKELVIEESISLGLDVLSLKHVYVIKGFKDGTILMGSYGQRHALFVYCPRRKTVVDMQILDHRYWGYGYRPSFHSLQNFENERVDVF